MAKPKSTDLQALLVSLSKSEKRYITLELQKLGNDLKIQSLFEAYTMHQLQDEDEILECYPRIKTEQFSNLKAHLYHKTLHFLRDFHLSHSRDIQLRECIDHAQLLLDRGMYQQCAKVLNKAKRLASQNDNLELNLEILKLQKQVFAQGIGAESQQKVNIIIQEVQDITQKINNINVLSNIQVRLNNWYVRKGFVRQETYSEEIDQYIQKHLPALDESMLSFHERLHLYEVYVTYFMFTQNFAEAHDYARRWASLFKEHPKFIPLQPMAYIRGLHKLLSTQERLYRYEDFLETMQQLKAVDRIPNLKLNENLRAMLFKYITIHELNAYFLTGSFREGTELVAQKAQELNQFVDQLGKHATITFYYKIACMYFGASDYRQAGLWLQKIINEQQVDLREDIHCFARILNLISHYEQENTDIIEYLIKSTYRFLLLRDDLQQYQAYILGFLRNLAYGTTETELIRRFDQLRQQLLTLTDNPYESRAFIYFDIISWLESKISKRSVEEVIQEKALRRMQQKSALVD
ncbi:MAG: hypothetical protein AAF944_27990 [Bacteroidota bacterium]